MKWLLFSCLLLAARAQSPIFTPEPDFFDDLNLQRALQKTCRVSVNKGWSKTPSLTRQVKSGTAWVSGKPIEMEQAIIAVEADLRAQLGAAHVRIPGGSYSNRLREIFFAAARSHGSIIIGPLYPDPQPGCPEAFAIHLHAERWSIQPRP
jgi:hypothetical protein